MTKTPKRLPVITLKGFTLFPKVITPIYLGREKSINAFKTKSKEIFIVSQKDSNVENPTANDLFTTGVVAEVIQGSNSGDGTYEVLLKTKYRATFANFKDDNGHYVADTVEVEDVNMSTPMLIKKGQLLADTFHEYAEKTGKATQDMMQALMSVTSASSVADTIGVHLKTDIDKVQTLLDEVDVEKRVDLLTKILKDEIELSSLDHSIQSNVKTRLEKSQKEYYLNEQLNAIKKELGEDDESEVETFEKKLAALDMPKVAYDITARELKKLKSIPPMSSEYGVTRNYVEEMTNLPWNKISEDDNDINKAQKILDAEHYGLKDVKERIVEHLAVRSLVGTKGKGTILCLAGPPGVGKTSIAKSLANSLNRNFVRVSLGGVRDEAEIRGHRKTYVGAMSGKIIQGLKKAGTSNPVMLLDEIDKMSSDHKGDPAAAMLEVLDPAQNSTFADHYLNTEYDLSKVMFIATANELRNIPGPLIDRMEIITLPGYMMNEKVQIAKKHLLKQAREDNGIKDTKVGISDKVLKEVIKGHTREAGVRGLKRTLDTICRKIAYRFVLSGETEEKVKVDSTLIKEYLGQSKFDREAIPKKNTVGLVNGLYVSGAGGGILPFTSIVTKGKGKVNITGNMKDVMKESSNIAMSCVRSLAEQFDVKEDYFDQHDIHLNAETASPKDGDSAGAAMTTAIMSAITGRAVRRDVAMTGAITLRGTLNAIGGVKEKILAAKESGCTVVIIPEQNRRDLDEVPQEIKDGIDIQVLDCIYEVLTTALV